MKSLKLPLTLPDTLAERKQLSVTKNQTLSRMARFIRHRINTQVSNLEMTMQLIQDCNLTEEQSELFQNYREISEQLSGLVSQLDTTVRFYDITPEARETFDLENVFTGIKRSSREALENHNASVYYDFSEIPVITFVPELLKLIFKELFLRGLENQQHGQGLEIKVYTVEEEGKARLVYEDNTVFTEALTGDAGHIEAYPLLNRLAIPIQEIKLQVEKCNARFEVQRKDKRGVKYSIYF